MLMAAMVVISSGPGVCPAQALVCVCLCLHAEAATQPRDYWAQANTNASCHLISSLLFIITQPLASLA